MPRTVVSCSGGRRNKIFSGEFSDTVEDGLGEVVSVLDGGSRVLFINLTAFQRRV